jgi:hypothetical protein
MIEEGLAVSVVAFCSVVLVLVDGGVGPERLPTSAPLLHELVDNPVVAAGLQG